MQRLFKRILIIGYTVPTIQIIDRDPGAKIDTVIVSLYNYVLNIFIYAALMKLDSSNHFNFQKNNSKLKN